jgi:hypothetical protein
VAVVVVVLVSISISISSEQQVVVVDVDDVDMMYIPTRMRRRMIVKLLLPLSYLGPKKNIIYTHSRPREGDCGRCNNDCHDNRFQEYFITRP